MALDRIDRIGHVGEQVQSRTDNNSEGVPPDSPNLLSRIVLNEISGKNSANHAYDKILWTVRTGYLTLIFVGWSLILKGITEAKLEQSRQLKLMVGLVLVSIGLSIGGWFIDRSYLRRKFRVILSQNELIGAIRNSPNSLQEIPEHLLAIAGDDADAPFRCRGYSENLHVANWVYFIPIMTIVAAMSAMLL